MVKQVFCDQAVVGVIEAILLIGLLAIILSTVQLIYVPKLMEDREASHMDDVAKQFAQLKFAVDLQASGLTNTSISTPITLGSREMPYLITARALGSIYVVNDACTVTVNVNSQSYVYRLGDIVYYADNAYYEKQTYVLENGAVILVQQDNDGTETMLAAPTFSSHLTGSNLDLSFLLLNISGYASRTSVESSLDTTYVRTNYYSSSSAEYSDVSSITISTSYPNAWYKFLNTSLDNDAVEVSQLSQSVEITPRDGYTMDLSLDVVKLCAQIGLGWME
ncbi:MAG TPA: hypothetical protein ENI42_02460 [Thermoplasmatales archaeon]|nr:hypothetical protein [Thermoplasmatales archaeon]